MLNKNTCNMCFIHAAGKIGSFYTILLYQTRINVARLICKAYFTFHFSHSLHVYLLEQLCCTCTGFLGQWQVSACTGVSEERNLATTKTLHSECTQGMKYSTFRFLRFRIQRAAAWSTSTSQWACPRLRRRFSHHILCFSGGAWTYPSGFSIYL